MLESLTLWLLSFWQWWRTLTLGAGQFGGIGEVLRGKQGYLHKNFRRSILMMKDQED